MAQFEIGAVQGAVAGLAGDPGEVATPAAQQAQIGFVGRIGERAFKFDQHAFDRDRQPKRRFPVAPRVEVDSSTEQKSLTDIGPLPAAQQRRDPVLRQALVAAASSGRLGGGDGYRFAEVALGQFRSEAVPKAGRDGLGRAHLGHIGVLAAHGPGVQGTVDQPDRPRQGRGPGLRVIGRFAHPAAGLILGRERLIAEYRRDPGHRNRGGRFGLTARPAPRPPPRLVRNREALEDQHLGVGALFPALPGARWPLVSPSQVASVT